MTSPRNDPHFTVVSSSRQTAEILEPLAASLRENPDGSLVRRFVFGRCVQNPNNPDASLQIRIRHQRRERLSAAWEDPDHFGPGQLQAGQEIRLDFSSGETLALYRRLEEWYAICGGGVTSGERTLSVVDENDVTILRGRERDVLQTLLANSDDFWDLLSSLEPDLFTTAALARIHAQRIEAIHDFETHIAAEDWAENDWQTFFEHETWIFGHGLAYQFLGAVAEQPAFGGIGVDRHGLQLGDFLLATAATARFTVLVEIKKPQTDLLGQRYRTNVYEPSRELVGGIAQVQAAVRTWVIEGSQAEANRGLADSGIETVEPKAILIVGNTANLTDLPMRRTFELFRRNLSRPEIVTFDELLARARYMLDVPASPSPVVTDDAGDEGWLDDVPF